MRHGATELILIVNGKSVKEHLASKVNAAYFLYSSGTVKTVCGRKAANQTHGTECGAKSNVPSDTRHGSESLTDGLIKA
jgi:hypothetical protein